MVFSGMTRICAVVALAGALFACGQEIEYAADKEQHDAAQSHQDIVTGNGERNYIVLEGASRVGATFTFPEVVIDKNGWLVMHPFKDGAPVQTVYVGATYVPAGESRDVAITIDRKPMTGEMFIVMLHYDVNDDQVFDFNDGITVPDVPVFEGNTLVALRYETPPEMAEAPEVSDDDIRINYRRHAALTQLHRWWQLYENDAVSIENQLDILAEEVFLKSGLGEATGHEAYRARVEALPDNWENAHFLETVDISFVDDTTTAVNATITYLNKGMMEDGSVRQAEVFYTTSLMTEDGLLPKFTRVEIRQGDVSQADSFTDAYPENRLRSLLHYWLALIEDPARTSAPFMEILADGFQLNFTSGVISDADSFDAWVKGPASSVAASKHDLEDFTFEVTGENAYRLNVKMNWWGLLPDGRRMVAKTDHTWDVVDDPSERFARIKTINVEVLKPFTVVEE
jgi:hypothetical protein